MRLSASFWISTAIWRLLTVFIILCGAAYLLALGVPSANATKETACPASQDTEVQAACIDGYTNGTGDGSTCGKYNGEQELVDICIHGFNQYRTDLDRCIGTTRVYLPSKSTVSFAKIYTLHFAIANSSVDPGMNDNAATPSSGRTEDQCRQELRGTTSTSSSTPNTPPRTTTPSEPGDNTPSNAIGMKPTDADISSRQVPHDEKTEHSECGIESMFGKLLCGITTFMASITDAAFGLLTVFLETPPILTKDITTNQDTPVYTAWSFFRGIANGAFIIAMLLVIYSHITGGGLSSYSLKRMLPRMIAAILLVNLSFYICAIFVDITNILGFTLKDTIINGFQGALNADGELIRSGYGTWGEVSGTVLLLGTTAALAGGAALFASLPVLLPVLVSALIAIVTTVFVLMLRQVLILLFIIISPLAFAAIVLPNTAKWFDKWRMAFVPIAMVFPAISFIYGASYVASLTIQNIATLQGNVILAIMSLGIQIIPFLLTPIIMKLGGKYMNQAGNLIQARGQKLKDKTQNYSNTMKERRDLKAIAYQPSTLGKARLLKRARAGIIKGRVNRSNRDKEIDKNLALASETHIEQLSQDDDSTLASKLGFTAPATKGDKFNEQVAQSSKQEDVARAKNHIIEKTVKAHAKIVEAKAVEDKGATRNDTLATAMAEEGVVTELAKEAAILRLCQAGDIGAILQLVKNSFNMSQQQRQTLVAQIRQSGVGSKIPFLANQDALDAIEGGAVSEATFGTNVIAPSLMQDDYSASTYADLDQDAAAEVAQVLGAVANGDEEMAKILGNLEGIDLESATQEEIEKILQTSKGIVHDHELTAYTALNNSDTSLRVGQNHKGLRRIADKYISHEEALVLNSLYDSGKRSEEPW